jgi:hypothetical protein
VPASVERGLWVQVGFSEEHDGCWARLGRTWEPRKMAQDPGREGEREEGTGRVVGFRIPASHPPEKD